MVSRVLLNGLRHRLTDWINGSSGRQKFEVLKTYNAQRQSSFAFLDIINKGPRLACEVHCFIFHYAHEFQHYENERG